MKPISLAVSGAQCSWLKQLDISPHERPREASVASVCVPCGDHFAQREENDLLVSLNSFLFCYVCVQWGLSSR
jgi:hypothetical protein